MTTTEHAWRCPNCGDRRKAGNTTTTWCMGSDCAWTAPAEPAQPPTRQPATQTAA